MYSVRCSGASALNTGRVSSPGFIAVKTAIQACCGSAAGIPAAAFITRRSGCLPPSTSKMEPPISIHLARPAEVLLRARSRPYRRERALRPSRGLITLREQKRWGSEFPDRGQRCALGHQRRIGCRSAGSGQPRTRKAIGICPSLFGEAVPRYTGTGYGIQFGGHGRTEDVAGPWVRIAPCGTVCCSIT
jgi:hypothetical protein